MSSGRTAEARPPCRYRMHRGDPLQPLLHRLPTGGHHHGGGPEQPALPEPGKMHRLRAVHREMSPEEGAQQAIFVIDDTHSGSEGLLSLPYEFTPLPIVGQSVILTDRRGRPVGEGTIHRVLCPPVFHQTAVVTLRVPLALLDTVRGFLPTSGKEVLHEG